MAVVVILVSAVVVVLVSAVVVVLVVVAVMPACTIIQVSAHDVVEQRKKSNPIKKNCNTNESKMKRQTREYTLYCSFYVHPDLKTHRSAHPGHQLNVHKHT